MLNLRAFPPEVFHRIIEHLVIDIGIEKAVLLRTVSHAFDAAIVQAIAVSQVVDVDDRATYFLSDRMPASLRGKILEVKAAHAPGKAGSPKLLAVLADINRALDAMFGAGNPEAVKARHESVAAAVTIRCNEPVDAQVHALNLLSAAAIVGDLDAVKSVLERDEFLSALANVNDTTPYFDEPLALAAARGHFAVVQHLLDIGAEQLEPDTMELTHWADLSGYERWRALDLNPPSALRAAIINGHDRIVHLLLRPEHRLPVTSFEYLRAILAGARVGRPHYIAILLGTIGWGLSAFASLGNEMMWEAIRHDRPNVVDLLLHHGVDVNAAERVRRRPPHHTLYLAAAAGNVGMVRHLLARGADPNFTLERSAPFHRPVTGAARAGQDDVVELLVEHGADAAEAFAAAAAGGQTRLMARLLARLPDLPARRWGRVGQRALIDAILAGNLTAITLLVEAGVPLNVADYTGTLPLDHAKELGVLWVIDHLRSLGAVETEREINPRPLENYVRGIRVSKRTWEWVGKY